MGRSGGRDLACASGRRAGVDAAKAGAAAAARAIRMQYQSHDAGMQAQSHGAKMQAQTLTARMQAKLLGARMLPPPPPRPHSAGVVQEQVPVQVAQVPRGEGTHATRYRRDRHARSFFRRMRKRRQLWELAAPAAAAEVALPPMPSEGTNRDGGTAPHTRPWPGRAAPPQPAAPGCGGATPRPGE